jgi:hypothetical protein
MNKLLLACALTSLAVVGTWAKDDQTQAIGATANAAPSKDTKKEADKRPKPKPTKKPRKPAPRPSTP